MTQNLNAPERTPPVLQANEVPRDFTGQIHADLPDDDDALKLFKPPPHLWAIWIAEDAALYTRFGRPNRVRRFFLWLFFGWRYTKVKKNA